ncbi:MAG: hypothetical protein H7836_16540, partial [Magnetococcus sp. YQC-3]
EEQSAKAIQDSKEQVEFNHFTEYLQKYTTGRTEVYNTERVSKRFGVKLGGWKHFEQLLQMLKDGKWSIEEYRKIALNSGGER